MQGRLVVTIGVSSALLEPSSLPMSGIHTQQANTAILCRPGRREFERQAMDKIQRATSSR